MTMRNAHRLSFSDAKIDLLVAADIPTAVDIERHSNSHPWSERNFHDALASGYLCLAARNATELCGFAIARSLLNEAELLLIAVAPENRRSGVATLLWNDLATRLRNTGANQLHLEVRTSNHIAQVFYTVCGFNQNGLRPNYYPSGPLNQDREDALLMQVSL